MSGFTRHHRSGVSMATFNAYEADLLRSLCNQLVELLRDGAPAPGRVDPFEELLDFSGPTHAPEDPVLARLLPDAYRDDDEAAGEFRRFTEHDLRHSKVAAATSIIDTLVDAGLPAEPEAGLFVDVELARAEAIDWMRTLTDLRLALAARLGIEDDDPAAPDAWSDLPDDDPAAQVHGVYEWLGFLQETLVRSLP